MFARPPGTSQKAACYSHIAIRGKRRNTPSCKSVYGVDLAQPDTIPASFISQFQRSVDDAQEKGAPIPSLPSISTQTLNTVIRLTGENALRASHLTDRTKSFSKMVAAFECFTAPLSSMRRPDEAFGYGDEDDDDPYVPTVTLLDGTIFPARPSTPEPNSQTFDYLLAYSCQTDHRLLAKNYLKLAFEQERVQSRSFRETVAKLLHPFRTARPKPLNSAELSVLLQQDVPLPRVQTNQHMFKVMVHLAKRKHDVQMLMWILNLERSVVIHKEQSLRALVKMATWIKDRCATLSASNQAAVTGRCYLISMERLC